MIVLTYNEERNLPRALRSVVGWAGAVFVVDSLSTDGTAAVAAQFDVPVYEHPFEHWATQRNWAFDNLPIATPWVLWLDADEQVTAGLAAEIAAAVQTVPDAVHGFYIDRRFYFMGRWLRWGGYSPNWVLRLVRPQHTRLIPAGDREYFRIDGEARHLRGYLHHEDSRGLASWIDKHNRISALAAHYRLDQEAQRHIGEQHGRLEGRWRVWLRDRVLARLPFWLEPLAFFGYRYILRLGFLDGAPGLIYYFLHDLWYPLLIAAKTIELRQRRRNG